MLGTQESLAAVTVRKLRCPEQGYFGWAAEASQLNCPEIGTAGMGASPTTAASLYGSLMLWYLGWGGDREGATCPA